MSEKQQPDRPQPEVAAGPVRSDTEQLSGAGAETAALDEFGSQIREALRSGAAESPLVGDHEQVERARLRDLAVEIWSGSASMALREPTPEPTLGTQLAAYRLIERIGHGGMGIVFEAEHVPMQRRVALKVMRAESAGRRFLNEIRVAGQLNNRHTVTVYDAGSDGGFSFLAMELIRGENLRKAVQVRGPMSFGAAAACCSQVARGLVQAHQLGFVHRDLKPSNVMLAKDPDSGDGTGRTVAKVLDLGLATAMDDVENSVIKDATREGYVVGTLDYMSPEQAAGEVRAEPTMDVYALGATLSFLTTGQSPLSSWNTPAEKLTALAEGNFAAGDTSESLSTECSGLIAALTAPNAEDRPADAGAALQIIESWGDAAELDTWFHQTLSSADSHEEPPRVTDEEHKSAQRKPRLPRWTLLFAAIISLALATISISLATNRGTLEIHCDDPNVEFVIKREGKIIQDGIRVERKQRSVQLRAGDCIVELRGLAAENYRVDRDAITISRGGEAVVRAIRRDTPSTSHQAVEWLLAQGVEFTLEGDSRRLTDSHVIAQQKRIGSVKFQLGGAAREYTSRLSLLAPVSHVWLTDSEIKPAALTALLRVQPLAGCERLSLQQCVVEALGDLSFLRRLERLDITGSPLTSEAFRDLRTLNPLRSIQLSNAGAKDEDLSHFNTSQLRTAWLDGNPLVTKQAVIRVLSAGDLETLNLTDTGVGDAAFLHDGPYSQRLWALQLSGTKVTDKTLGAITRYPRLQQLALSRTAITAEGLAFVASLPLRELYLDDNPQLGDRAAEVIADYGSLRELSLARTSVSETGIRSLAKLETLQRLSLTGVHLGTGAVETLATMQGLRHLDLWGTGLSTSSIQQVKDSLPNCTVTAD